VLVIDTPTCAYRLPRRGCRAPLDPLGMVRFLPPLQLIDSIDTGKNVPLFPKCINLVGEGKVRCMQTGRDRESLLRSLGFVASCALLGTVCAGIFLGWNVQYAEEFRIAGAVIGAAIAVAAKAAHLV
jgi:hypothetical protein